MRRYKAKVDRPLLQDLYASWGPEAICPPDAELPITGLIEPGLAAVFLYRTDSTLATLEHAITMKKAPGAREALEKICAALTEKARAAGVKRLFVYVGNEAAVVRAKAVGFTLSPEPQRWQLERNL